jgi:hypothetical protein
VDGWVRCVDGFIPLGKTQAEKKSFPTSLDPYPGGSCAAHARFFAQDNGFAAEALARRPTIYPHGNFCVERLYEAAVIR